jgi:hypothetical protein
MSAGCAAEPVPHQGAGLEWTRIAEAHAALIALLYEGAKSAADGDGAALAAAQSVLTKVGACVHAESFEASVHYTFTDCQGLPYGLSALSGSLVARYTVSGDDQGGFVGMSLEGTGVAISGATLDVKADVSNILSRRDWHNHPALAETNHLGGVVESSGTSKEGHRITFEKIEEAPDTGLELVYGDSGRCVDFDSSPPSLEKTGGTIESDGVVWGTEIEGYRRCGDTCPEAKGFVAVVGVLDGRLTNETPSFVRFDGSAIARQFTFFAGIDGSLDNRGKSGPIVLGCVPAASK